MAFDGITGDVTLGGTDLGTHGFRLGGIDRPGASRAVTSVPLAGGGTVSLTGLRVGAIPITLTGTVAADTMAEARQGLERIEATAGAGALEIPLTLPKAARSSGSTWFVRLVGIRTVGRLAPHDYGTPTPARVPVAIDLEATDPGCYAASTTVGSIGATPKDFTPGTLTSRRGHSWQISISSSPVTVRLRHAADSRIIWEFGWAGASSGTLYVDHEEGTVRRGSTGKLSGLTVGSDFPISLGAAELGGGPGQSRQPSILCLGGLMRLDHRPCYGI